MDAMQQYASARRTRKTILKIRSPAFDDKSEAIC
jgi:hypothetical protein